MRLDTYQELAINHIMLALIDKTLPEINQIGTIRIADQIIMITFQQEIIFLLLGQYQQMLIMPIRIISYLKFNH